MTPAEDFAIMVRELLGHLKSTEPSPDQSYFQRVQDLLGRIYLAACGLPETEPVAEGLCQAPDADRQERQIQSQLWDRLAPNRDFYHQVMDPFFDSSVGGGLISSQLAELAGDLADGLACWDVGRQADAVWAWRFGLKSHWGLRHSQSCMLCTSFFTTTDSHPTSGQSAMPSQCLHQAGGNAAKEVIHLRPGHHRRTFYISAPAGGSPAGEAQIPKAAPMLPAILGILGVGMQGPVPSECGPAHLPKQVPPLATIIDSAAAAAAVSSHRASYGAVHVVSVRFDGRGRVVGVRVLDPKPSTAAVDSAVALALHPHIRPQGRTDGAWGIRINLGRDSTSGWLLARAEYSSPAILSSPPEPQSSSQIVSGGPPTTRGRNVGATGRATRPTRVEVVVSAAGTAARVRTLQSSGNGLLDAIAEDRARQSRFEPARLDGEVIEGVVEFVQAPQ